MTITYDTHLISYEERETTITIDHYTRTFSVYTSKKSVSIMLNKQFPSYYELAPDKASASLTPVPLHLLTKLHLSAIKGQVSK